MKNLLQDVVGASHIGVRFALGAALLILSLLAVGIACSSPSAPADTPTPVPPDTPTPVPTATPVPPDTPTPVPTAVPVPSEPFKLGILDAGIIDFLINDVPLQDAHPQRIEDSGPHYRAALLAVKHVNDAGGVWGKPVTHTSENSLPPPDGAPIDEVRLTEKMINEGAHGVVGASSRGVLLMSELVTTAQVPVISPFSSAPSVADLEDGGFIFRTLISDAAQAYALGDLAHEDGYDHIAITYDDDAWGRGFAAAFTEHFNGRVDSVPLHPTEASYPDEVRQVAEDDAHALLLIAFRPNVISGVMDEVAEHNHFEEFLLFDGLRTIDFYNQYPDLLEGAKGVAPYSIHITEAEGHWEADYLAEYGPDDIEHAPYARAVYDGVVALLLAAEHAQSTDGEAIRDSLHAIAGPPGKRYPASGQGIKDALQAIRNGEEIDLDGESATLDWDHRGELVSHTFVIWQFKNGAIEDLRHIEVDISE